MNSYLQAISKISKQQCSESLCWYYQDIILHVAEFYNLQSPFHFTPP